MLTENSTAHSKSYPCCQNTRSAASHTASGSTSTAATRTSVAYTTTTTSQYHSYSTAAAAPAAAAAAAAVRVTPTASTTRRPAPIKSSCNLLVAEAPNTVRDNRHCPNLNEARCLAETPGNIGDLACRSETTRVQDRFASMNKTKNACPLPPKKEKTRSANWKSQGKRKRWAKPFCHGIGKASVIRSTGLCTHSDFNGTGSEFLPSRSTKKHKQQLEARAPPPQKG